MIRLLCFFMVILTALPASASDLDRDWQGAVWGSSQHQAVQALSRKGWVRVFNLDNGVAVLRGNYGGYKSEAYVDPGPFVKLVLTIDAESLDAGVDIADDLFGAIGKRYGSAAGMFWRNAQGNDQDWRVVDPNEVETLMVKFRAGRVEMSFQWDLDHVELRMTTIQLDNHTSPRTIYVSYRHLNGLKRLEQRRERQRLDSL